MAESPPLLVAAIDFGSSGAGYAFQFLYQYNTNPIDVSTSVWNEGQRISEVKQPCVMLFDSSKKFISFGYKAEDDYEDLNNKGQGEDWFLLKGFKMQLYDAVINGEDIREDFELIDLGGKSISAKLVFSTAINYLKDHLTIELNRRGLGCVSENTRWVLSVPAIWTESAKQFMRESAEAAGITGKNLVIVYEPEAASVYARLLPVDKLVGHNKEMVFKCFDSGRKFIVVDAGGGTVDISTQEVADTGDLKIIHKVCGGPWGGQCVNREFMKLMIEVFGVASLKAFKETRGEDLLTLNRDLETKKVQFKKSRNTNVNIRMPINFVEFMENFHNKDFNDVLKESKYAQSLTLKRDKLIVDAKLFLSCFKESINKILDEIKTILHHERCADVSAVMLVGGYAESEALQNALKEEFSTLEVFIPLEGSSAVLKGAVIYGQNPKVVISRVCSHTFGFKAYLDFIPGFHKPEYAFLHDGVKRCNNIFIKLFHKDDEIEVGTTRSHKVNKTFYTQEAQQARSQSVRVQLYSSEEREPMYVTDQGCSQLATILIAPTNGMWPEELNGTVEMQIGGTEIFGTFINDDTRERHSVQVEYVPLASQTSERKRLYDPFNIDI